MRMPRSLAVSSSGTRLPFDTMSQLCPAVHSLATYASGSMPSPLRHEVTGKAEPSVSTACT